jgi:UDP-3-O-[3-hydroxymyristoyl] glucosamine N-acyltransferase
MADLTSMADMEFARIGPDVKLGRDVKVYAFVNLYGCTIGDECKIGMFVEIQKGVVGGQPGQSVEPQLPVRGGND